jgi:hypothetical protein
LEARFFKADTALGSASFFSKCFSSRPVHPIHLDRQSSTVGQILKDNLFSIRELKSDGNIIEIFAHLARRAHLLPEAIEKELAARYCRSTTRRIHPPNQGHRQNRLGHIAFGSKHGWFQG